ncbi:uncharacterized protein LOC110709116 [Chenopodium quinoa]|uniref:Uncharacterized protein n=1 Tax=Chenopodium quinoa TaxID=63459 RepID=A0A803N7I7_CHEQI|nr:uncharacterized protein LOC110709116 [Chenopodium quinoa]
MGSIHAYGSGADDHEQSSTMKVQYACSGTTVDTLQKLGNAFHDNLLVNSENLDTGILPSDDNGSSSSSSLEDKDTGSGDFDSDLEGSIATSCKCLHKCATFPVAVKEEATLDYQSESKSCMRSLSLPTESKLVSALKGSREKIGGPPRKLSVSWAPDVYDPPPTSLSHYPKKKNQQQSKSSKKHGKGKQKSKSVRGGGSATKDKKHYHKSGGRSDRCLDSFAETDRVLSSNSYKSLDLLDFNEDDIGSPDSNCSSSFLGQAGGTMHCVC